MGNGDQERSLQKSASGHCLTTVRQPEAGRRRVRRSQDSKDKDRQPRFWKRIRLTGLRARRTDLATRTAQLHTGQRPCDCRTTGLIHDRTRSHAKLFKIQLARKRVSIHEPCIGPAQMRRGADAVSGSAVGPAVKQARPGLLRRPSLGWALTRPGGRRRYDRPRRQWPGQASPPASDRRGHCLRAAPRG